MRRLKVTPERSIRVVSPVLKLLLVIVGIMLAVGLITAGTFESASPHATRAFQFMTPVSTHTAFGAAEAPTVSTAGLPLEINRWEEARKAWHFFLAQNPEDAQAHFRYGILLIPVRLQTGQYYLSEALADPVLGEMVSDVLRILDVYLMAPRSEMLTQVAMTLVQNGYWVSATSLLEAAVRMDAVNPPAWALWGWAEDRLGQDGIDKIERALDMSPNDPFLHYILGLHWRQRDDDLASLAAFQQAYWLDPGNPALAIEVANSLRATGDLAGAVQWYWVAVELDPSNRQWRVLLGEFYADTGFDLEGRGLSFLEQTAREFPESSSLQASVGWAYYRLNRLDHAYERLADAVALAPGNVRSRYYFGMVLEAQGETGGAADSYWYVVEHAQTDSVYRILAQRGLERLGHPSPG